MMDTQAILDQARKLAATAKPGILKLNGKTYTLVFDQQNWTYTVYEDMVFFCNYNTKKLHVAKKWLREHFQS